MKKGKFVPVQAQQAKQAIQLALKFVEEHKEQFEQWIKEKKERGEIEND